MRRIVALALLTFACTSITAVDKRPVKPLPEWQTAAENVERCLDADTEFNADDFRRIRFFLVDEIRVNGENANGVWRPTHEILFAAPTREAVPVWIVRHELIHWMVQGGDDHPDRLFRCELRQIG